MYSDKDSTHAITIDSLQKIIDYIESNISIPLTPSIIAKKFFLSVSSVNILFRVICDISIMEYIRNRRLTLAGGDLLSTNIRIIDLAYKYGYETPEAFTRAFTRFHGYPPGFVRRVYPPIKVFNPLHVNVDIQGGWAGSITARTPMEVTKISSSGQDKNQDNSYSYSTKFEGGINMETGAKTTFISTEDMEQKEDWRILLTLARKLDLEGIAFKVDGRTMIFAHGLEFKLEKICLTFKWNEEQRILDFFGHKGKADTSFMPGFKYFDAVFENMKIRCMFYCDYSNDNSDELLFRDTDLVDVDGQTLHVQTVDFYLQNAEPEKRDEFYQMVCQWAKNRI